MKAADVRQLSDQELRDKIAIEGEQLAKIKVTHAVSELENPMQLRERRKTLARLNTELRKRELTNNEG